MGKKKKIISVAILAILLLSIGSTALAQSDETVEVDSDSQAAIQVPIKKNTKLFYPNFSFCSNLANATSAACLTRSWRVNRLLVSSAMNP